MSKKCLAIQLGALTQFKYSENRERSLEEVDLVSDVLSNRFIMCAVEGFNYDAIRVGNKALVRKVMRICKKFGLGVEWFEEHKLIQVRW